jgi:hypothetical protein
MPAFLTPSNHFPALDSRATNAPTAATPWARVKGP